MLRQDSLSYQVLFVELETLYWLGRVLNGIHSLGRFARLRQASPIFSGSCGLSGSIYIFSPKLGTVLYLYDTL